MRRAIFIAAAVVLALAGAAFAADSLGIESRYRQLTQRERVIATQTIQTPEGQLEWMNWESILKAGNTTDICDDITFELTSHTITHNADYSELGAGCHDRHVAILLKADEHRATRRWWEAPAIPAIKTEWHGRIDLWGRCAPGFTFRRGSAHVV